MIEVIMVQFSILRDHNRITTLDFRRADFGFLFRVPVKLVLERQVQKS